MSTDEITALHKKLDQIHGAIVGNPDLGHKGIVHRLDEVETKQADSDRKLLRWGGIVTGVILAIQFFKDRIAGSN